MDQIQEKQYSDDQHMINLYKRMQWQVSALQTAAVTPRNMSFDNERFPTLSYVKQGIYYKFIDILKRTVSKRIDECDPECFCLTPSPLEN